MLRLAKGSAAVAAMDAETLSAFVQFNNSKQGSFVTSDNDNRREACPNKSTIGLLKTKIALKKTELEAMIARYRNISKGFNGKSHFDLLDALVDLIALGFRFERVQKRIDFPPIYSAAFAAAVGPTEPSYSYSSMRNN
jgi:hypothetical protein